MSIDLQKEQQRTLERTPLNYGAAARFFFFAMDLTAGKKDTLAKAKLLEILACIPYREWEIRQYVRLTFRYFNRQTVDWAQDIITWGRSAQDNEYMHLLVIEEKMKEDGLKDTWFLSTPIVFFITAFYILLSKGLAWFNIIGAFRFNAEFEDHAEHIYAQMVQDHPEWEKQAIKSHDALEYASTYSTSIENWADIFRRISLDERDHRNHSFHFANSHEYIVHYTGMPGEEDAIS